MADPLAQVALLDPLTIQLMRQDVAAGMDKSRPGAFVSPNVLAQGIADLIYTEAVQGATFLEVHIIDPGWQMLQPMRKLGGQSFIDVDEDGWLQSVNFEFPRGSKKHWTMVAANPTTDLSGANLTLTFEDATSTYLRQKDGPSVSHPNETRLEFIKRLLSIAHVYGKFEFSAATKAFETEPPQQTPASIVAYDKAWTKAQKDKQAVAAALGKLEQNVKDAIGNLSLTSQPATAPTSQQWYEQNPPGYHPGNYSGELGLAPAPSPNGAGTGVWK